MQYTMYSEAPREKSSIWKDEKVKDKEQKKWQEVLQIEYMSSEDSDGRENELKVCQLLTMW